MKDAWDELRELMRPYGGEAAAQALVDRLRSVSNQPGWNFSLNLTGNRARVTYYWVEPVMRNPLTSPEDRPQN